MRILITGATGMLGYEVFRICIQRGIEVHALVRNKKVLIDKFGNNIDEFVHEIADIKNTNEIKKVVEKVQPNFLINCIGIVKQSHLAEDQYESIAINSFLPHQLQKMAVEYDFKLIHISTDCVFDGKKGMYSESDITNAYDLYGRSKALGETGNTNAITLRTSIIGHEINGQSHGLLEWFLSQIASVKGFKKAIFSGLTTLELSKVILDVIVSKGVSNGLYQVAADPISKFDLITLIKNVYKKDISIEPDENFVIDRSLNGSMFSNITGYITPSWEVLIKEMYLDFNKGY